MPELPEVETVRLGLQRFLPKQKIQSVAFDWPKSFPASKKELNEHVIGATIVDVNRRAKVLLIGLSTGYTLMIHLKMTGQLVYRPNGWIGKSSALEHQARFLSEKRTEGVDSAMSKRAPQEKIEDDAKKTAESLALPESRLAAAEDLQGFGGGHPTNSLIGKLPDRSTRVTFQLTKGELFFNDQRKFGWIRLCKTAELKNDKFLSKLGPEPLERSYTFEQFKTAVQKRSKTSIKAAILDQTVLAGVGNIYADEGLFKARIHPGTKVADVSTVKLKRLFDAIREVMRLSIKLGGSSDRNYVDAEGKKGSYLGFANVFRREGQPCPHCGGNIVKIRVAGRGTHICPKCQKLPKKK